MHYYYSFTKKEELPPLFTNLYNITFMKPANNILHTSMSFKLLKPY